MNPKPYKPCCLAIAVVVLLLPIATLAATGSIDATNKYAWGSNVGWVNFNPTNGIVQVSDSGLSGYAWSENYGWINLNPADAGVKNDSTGVLSGYAWGENTGYINFSGVAIDSQGVFTGTSTGDIVGSLAFNCSNCKVVTTWRPASGASAPTVLVGGGYPPPAFRINGGASSTVSPNVSFSFSVLPAVTSFAITTNYGSASSTATSTYASVLPWNLCSGLSSCGPGAYLVSVRFLDSSGSLVGAASQAIAYAAASSSTATSTGPVQLQVPPSHAPASTPAATNVTSSFAFSRDLSLGMMGTDVAAWQRYLIAQASGPAARALSRAGATGYFGSATRAATKEYQQKAGITPASGYFGPATRAHIDSQGGNNAPVSSQPGPQAAPTSSQAAAFTRDLSLGMTGNDVTELQRYLVSANTGPAARALKANGMTRKFGTLTQRALSEFQKKAGIQPAGGYFGPKTRAYVAGEGR